MKQIQIIVGVIGIALAGCGQSNSQTTNEVASSNAPLSEPVMLKEGATAYIRMKEFTSKPLKAATPTGGETKLEFGDNVNLVQKKDGPAVFWLVSKGQTQAWIPGYVLTANKAEVDFLKDNNRIPETMTFLSVESGKDRPRHLVWGRVSVPGLFVMDSDGQMPIPGFEEGTSPFALKGNAVVFDSPAAKSAWRSQPVFDSAKKAFQLSPTCLYYCVSDGDKPAFECIDLVALKFRK